MKKLKKAINKIKKAICTRIFVLDSLFILGVLILLGTNFMVHPIFGLYSLAIFLIGFSIYISHTKQE